MYNLDAMTLFTLINKLCKNPNCRHAILKHELTIQSDHMVIDVEYHIRTRSNLENSIG